MLDQQRTAHSPATWTGDRVRQRLVEALITNRKMPQRGFIQAIVSSWPLVLHEFHDVLHWNNPGDTARDRQWESWANAKGADAIEVSRMEEAEFWLSWLPDDERKCIDAWAKCKAFGFPLTKGMKKIRFTKSTFNRKVNDASARIADRLNRQGVQVR